MGATDDSISLVGIYRPRNAQHVQDVSAPILARGGNVAWWALDEIVDDLAAITVGSGQGAKLPLLNEILRRSDTSTAWLVVSDDDLVFDRGDAVALVSLLRPRRPRPRTTGTKRGGTSITRSPRRAGCRWRAGRRSSRLALSSSWGRVGAIGSCRSPRNEAWVGASS